jgi:hypothetical protein
MVFYAAARQRAKCISARGLAERAVVCSATNLTRNTATMHLLSLNNGQPRENPWKRLAATGIDKRPVDGSVMVTTPGPKGTGAVGLAGD